MGANTFRGRSQRQLAPATYWRRRFFALVAGFAILSLIAWAFSGALATRTAASPAAGTWRSTAAPAEQHGLVVSRGPGAATVPRRATSPTGPAGALAPRHRPPASAAATPPAGSANPAHPARPARYRPRACRAGAVVISVASARASYGRGQLPEFDVDVVSTAARTCAFNVGPRFVALVITAGRKRVWSSADCVAGPGSLVTDLVRGVPTVLPISWDLRSTRPGCARAPAKVPTGSYAATAAAGGLTSSKEIFRVS